MNQQAGKRSRLIYGVTLPLAIFVGYLLATPQELTSLAVILALTFTLCIPILLRWHHLLLIFSWNASLTIFFLPGWPALWMAMSALCFGLAAVNWVMGKNSWQLQTSPVTYALLLFSVVVVLTALASGGVGLYAFGSSSFGGKGYFYILLAVAGYFAITSQSVPVERVPLYVTLFFLTGLSALVGLACYFLGPSAGFLTLIFPVSQETAETQA